MLLQKKAQVRAIRQDHIKDLSAQNEARTRLGLAALKIRVRRCISCKSLFESLEARTCGCSEEKRGQVISFMGNDALVGY